MNQSSWNKDFEEFTSTDSRVNAPSLGHLRQLIITDLTPSLSTIFLKLLACIAAVSIPALIACPQFGFGYGKNTLLINFFMSFGHWWCSMLCGVFFLGCCTLVSFFSLRPEEIRILRRGAALYIPLLVIVILSCFALVGGSLNQYHLSAWSIGAMVSGMLMIELHFRWRASLPNLD